MKQWVPFVLASLIVIALVVAVLRLRSDVKPDELARLIDRADRLAVKENLFGEGAVLFESSDRNDLDALKAALQVERPGRFMHCMCNGNPVIVLSANGEPIGRITNHHAKLIRCDLWRSDAPLADTEALLRWFDERKIPGPRKEYEEALKEQKQFDEAEARWLEAMPPALKPHWPAAKRSFDPNLAPLRKALAKQIPDGNERILALFAWYGSGMGPWSGFPSYEDIAANLLFDYPTEELLAALEGKDLTATQLEGIARFFGDVRFPQRRPDERRLLPAELKDRLLEHCLASSDKDKQSRARRAFRRE
jgi:hypothetical protein